MHTNQNFILGIYLLLGLAGGLFAGLLGIGGGMLFIIILPSALAALGVGWAQLPEAVIANSLYATFFSAVGATASHVAAKRRGIGYIFWVGVPAAISAALSLHFIATAAWFSRAVFLNIIIALLALLIIRSVWQLLRKTTIDQPEKPRPRKPPYWFTGVVAGLVSSLSGLGGGIIVVPAMRYWARLPALQANFVSSGTIVISSAGAVVAALLAPDLALTTKTWGLIVPAVSTPLAFGVLAGSPVGVWLSKKLSDRMLTALYCVFLLTVLTAKLIEAGYISALH